MNKIYTYKELIELSIIDLTSIAENSRIEIQNSFRRGLVSDILQRQNQENRTPSEAHARDRYAMVSGFKTLIIAMALMTSVGCTNYAAAAPKGRKSGVSMVQKIQYKIRKHKCKLSQQACHVRGDINFNWERRPKGSWPFEFLQ